MRVIVYNKQFTYILAINELDLVLEEELVGVVVYIKGLLRYGWVGAFKDSFGNIGLDKGLLQLVRESVVI